MRRQGGRPLFGALRKVFMLRARDKLASDAGKLDKVQHDHAMMQTRSLVHGRRDHRESSD